MNENLVSFERKLANERAATEKEMPNKQRPATDAIEKTRWSHEVDG